MPMARGGYGMQMGGVERDLKKMATDGVGLRFNDSSWHP